MATDTRKETWLAVSLLIAVGGPAAVFLLMGFSLTTAIVAVVAAICPALLVWIYFGPASGSSKAPDDDHS